MDDKFYGSMTAAIADHHGSTEIELEEAYVQTMPGFGLPVYKFAPQWRAGYRFTLMIERRKVHDQEQWWGTFEYGSKKLKVIGTLEKD